MAVDIWMVAVITLTALSAGILIGKNTGEVKEEPRGKTDEKARKEDRGGNKQEGRVISSPAEGEVRVWDEGMRQGAEITPKLGRLYAPVSGKILKLYPMGRAMLIRSDSGVEVLLKTGTDADELCSMYFRARVVQNEVINKGKLLLEFDKEALEKNGVDVSVSVSVETCEDGCRFAVTPKERVKVGEELLWV